MRRQELLVFIGVTGLVVIMFFIYLIFSLFSSSQPEPSPEATPIPKPSIQARSFDNFTYSPPPTNSLPSLSPANSSISKSQLVDLLPISTDSFDIEYLSQGDIFVVTIKKPPYEESKEFVDKWFRDQGFDTSKLNIYWNAFPEVKI